MLRISSWAAVVRRVFAKRRTELSLVSGLALFLFSATADPGEPVKVEARKSCSHQLRPRGAIHFDGPLPSRFENYISLRVIVAADGSVESAKAIAGPEKFFSEAESIEAKRRFTPFVKYGVPVRAEIEDFVSVLPPERWAKNVPFPEIKDWNSLRMRLKRTVCYGDCPAYSVEIRGNGEVAFTGEAYVFAKGSHRGTVSKQMVSELLEVFRRANYFSLDDKYSASITDNPAYTTSIEFDGRRKSVVDYVGLVEGMPEVVEDVEDSIDRVAGTKKWVSGDQQNRTGSRPR